MEQITWTNADGLKIQAIYWPVDQAQAVITLVHGIGEHIGRYEHVARWYNAHGIAVLGFDHQGFGRSEGPRGHAKSLDALLDDMGQAIAETRRRQPGIPHFLYGHSLGGNLVLNYLLRRKPDLAGVIATGPWIRLAFPAPFLKVLTGRLLHRFLPTLRLPNGLAVQYISHDRAVVETYQQDPLVHDRLSLAAGIQLLDASIWLDKFEGETPLPLLLQHGGADRLTNAAATADFAKRITGPITHREWPGLYHEIHNEPEKETVFEFTLDWMENFCLKPFNTSGSF